jgi:cysteinyl-tRNA synthetase
VEAAVTKALGAFDAALGDDLNTPEALSAVHVLVGEANSLLAAGEMTREGAAGVRGAIEKMDSVLGVLLPQGEDRLSAEEQALFDERQEARRKREFARADEARRKLEGLGIVLEDSAKGTRWRRKR